MFPTMPPKKLPFPPMEAELVEELPTGDWQYEPKWDGFRGVLENLGGGSRSGRETAGRCCATSRSSRRSATLLPPESALDGEIVISREGRLDFDSAAATPPPRGEPDQQALRRDPGGVHRLRHPPLEGRNRSTSCRWRSGGASSSGRRRSASTSRPATRDAKQAAKLARPARAAGLDGVVAKRLGQPYLPGLTRGRRQGEAVPDRRLRDRRLPLERQGGRADLDAAARPLRRRRRARLRRPLLGVPGSGAARARGGAAEAARRRES